MQSRGLDPADLCDEGEVGRAGQHDVSVEADTIQRQLRLQRAFCTVLYSLWKLIVARANGSTQ